MTARPTEQAEVDWVRYSDSTAADLVTTWHAERDEKLLCEYEFSSPHERFHRTLFGGESPPALACSECIAILMKNPAKESPMDCCGCARPLAEGWRCKECVAEILGDRAAIAADVTIAQAGGWKFWRRSSGEPWGAVNDNVTRVMFGTFPELAALAAAEVLK